MSDAIVYDPTRSSWTSPIRSATEEERLADEAYREVQRDPGSWWKTDWHTVSWLKQNGFGSVIVRLQSQGYIDGYQIVNEPVVIGALEDAGLVWPEKTNFTEVGGGGGGQVTTAQRIENMMAEMRNAALAWNVRIDDTNLRALATTAVNGNYNSQKVMNTIGKWAVAQDANVTNLVEGPLGEAINQLAQNYGVKLSTSTANNYLRGFVQGTETEESIKALLAKQAAALYPSLSERFAKGETFEDVVSPYREMASRLLEKEAGSFDFIGTNLNQAFVYNPDGKGERTMSMGEFANYLRTNQEFGYEYTTDARNKAYGAVRALASVFGRA